jgi:hypothetical protein
MPVHFGTPQLTRAGIGQPLTEVAIMAVRFGKSHERGTRGPLASEGSNVDAPI